MDGGGGASSSSSLPGTSFVVLSVSIVGILAISLLLLAYYLFLTRCGLLFFWRPDLQLHDDGRHRISISVTVQEPPRRSGLDDAAIRRIPTFRYRDDGKRQHHQQQLLLAGAGAKAAAGECAVCLADFRGGERLRLLPPCLHAFHIDCIDAWLQATANCPLCRAAVAPPSPGGGGGGLRCHLDAAPRATEGDIVIDIPSSEERPAAGTGTATAQSVLPMRRSLSMDSCADKRFYLALQRMLQQSSGSPAAGEGEGAGCKGESAGAGSGRSSRRLRRSFFSFSQSQGSRSAVLPLDMTEEM